MGIPHLFATSFGISWSRIVRMGEFSFDFIEYCAYVFIKVAIIFMKKRGSFLSLNHKFARLGDIRTINVTFAKKGMLLERSNYKALDAWG